MKPWKYTLDLSDVWGKEWDDHNVHELSTIVADRLEALCGEDFKGDWDFEEIVERLYHVPTNEIWQRYVEEHGTDILPYTPLELFDIVWEEFYDWADMQRVWVQR